MAYTLIVDFDGVLVPKAHSFRVYHDVLPKHIKKLYDLVNNYMFYNISMEHVLSSIKHSSDVVESFKFVAEKVLYNKQIVALLPYDALNKVERVYLPFIQKLDEEATTEYSTAVARTTLSFLCKEVLLKDEGECEAVIVATHCPQRYYEAATREFFALRSECLEKHIPFNTVFLTGELTVCEPSYTHYAHDVPRYPFLKNQPYFWKTFKALLGLDGKELHFVDDSKENIANAERNYVPSYFYSI